MFDVSSSTVRIFNYTKVDTFSKHRNFHKPLSSMRWCHNDRNNFLVVGEREYKFSITIHPHTKEGKFGLFIELFNSHNKEGITSNYTKELLIGGGEILMGVSILKDGVVVNTLENMAFKYNPARSEEWSGWEKCILPPKVDQGKWYFDDWERYITPGTDTFEFQIRVDSFAEKLHKSERLCENCDEFIVKDAPIDIGVGVCYNCWVITQQIIHPCVCDIHAMNIVESRYAVRACKD